MARRLNRETSDLHEFDRVAGYPERVLQFGTGRFLRGFAEYFLQKAHLADTFHSRVVLVGSTGSGRIEELRAQSGLYTLVVRGREEGLEIDEVMPISVVGRALSAREHWSDVLALSAGPDLMLVISNTTEVGIRLDSNDRIDADPPSSFPGKLTAVLHERARAFNFDPSRGLTILPCELIDSNGDRLRTSVLTQAERWKLGVRFSDWVEQANTFCNTLVDRIVPGTPSGEQAKVLEERLGYEDRLAVIAEPYRLWAIEGDEAFARRFPLAGVDPGIVVVEDIEPYRERKVRILNGTHTAMVPSAILAGFQTVRDAVEDPLFSQFIRRIALDEIVPSLPDDRAVARSFAESVLERFANPFIRHELVDITLQQTRKLALRVIPTLSAYHARFDRLPPAMMLGLAGFIVYSGPSSGPGTGLRARDDAEPYWADIWHGRSCSNPDDVISLVSKVAADESLLGCRLDRYPGFVDDLSSLVTRIDRTGIRNVIATCVD